MKILTDAATENAFKDATFNQGFASFWCSSSIYSPAGRLPTFARTISRVSGSENWALYFSLKICSIFRFS